VVGTGMEKWVAENSDMLVKSQEDGTVRKATATEVTVRTSGGREVVHKLRKYYGLNERTCLNQRPVVREGDKVRKGQVIADGPSTDLGELALGRNVLVAFMPWNGYNFEDAINISERVAKPFLRFWPLVLVMAGFVLMKREARVREVAAVSERAPAGGNAFDQGALSTDIENAILRRVRGAHGSRDAAGALVRELKDRFERFSWVGIYRLQGDLLFLDDREFVGASPEHRRIPLTQGVCGAAARDRATIVVPDVCADDRYLSCSPTVKSEIVVPIVDRGNMVGVLDIDSDVLDAFTDDDRRFLESLVSKAARSIGDEPIAAA